MNDDAMILRNDAGLSASFTPQALALKNAALESAALIGKVTNGTEQEQAVAAQTELAQLLKLAEEARKAAKEPVLTFGKRIDDSAKVFCDELKTEQWRLSRLCGDYQQLEQAKARAAQRAEDERLAALEREKQAAMAKAETHEELEKTQAVYQERIAAEAPPMVAIPKAAGQRVENVIQYEVFDLDALYKSNPACVKMEPKAVEIKALLKAGLKPPGVRSWTETKSTIRTSSQPKAITV